MNHTITELRKLKTRRVLFADIKAGDRLIWTMGVGTVTKAEVGPIKPGSPTSIVWLTIEKDGKSERHGNFPFAFIRILAR